MLHILTILSSLLVVASGIYVFSRGDWRKFQLKFAGVILCTVASVWFTIYYIATYEAFKCTMGQYICSAWEIYGMARNIAFIVFNISVGRDAIEYKKKDRRKYAERRLNVQSIR